MNLDFSRERWQRVAATYDAWWRGELDRPLIAVGMQGRDPGRPEPDLPWHRFLPFYDLSIPADAIADRVAYELECAGWLGDGFPSIHPNFGAGAIAAFMGLELKNGDDTVWFHNPDPVPPPEMALRFRDDTVWFRRAVDIVQAMVDRFEGMVQIAMPDLGGNLDILSSYRPSELLLMDLYDYPDDIKRLTWEAHAAWWQYFDAFNAILQPVNHGYTSWTPLLSSDTSYMLQCDFCYMIGPDMFAEFVLPELAATSRRLANPFYHWDGPGQIPHLDHLLSIPELKGIQWVPGAGSPDVTEWPDLFRRIRAGGKLAQVVPGRKGIYSLDAVAEQVGSARGLYILGGIDPDGAADAVRFLKTYGVEP
jgi:hypothetical protein